MKFFIFDYLKCDPFELNFRIRILGGFWPLETDDRQKKLFFAIFGFFSHFSVTLIVFNQVLDIFLLTNNLLELARHLCVISISGSVVIKSYLLLYKFDSVNLLKKNLEAYKNTRTDREDVEVLEKSDGHILIIIKTFYSISVPCVLIWMVYPALDSAEEKKVPFPYVLPWDEWTQTTYVTVYTYHSLAMLGYMINVLTVDGMFCGFVLRINAHYDIIINKFKVIDQLGIFNNSGHFGRKSAMADDDDDETHLKTVIRENIKLHQELLHEFSIFKTIYGALSMVHFIGATTAIATVILDTVVLYSGFRLETLQRILYVTITLWDVFVYCFCASKLQEKSHELSVAVYSIKWYEMKPDIRKDLWFIMLKAQRAPKLYVGRLFLLDMSSFAKLLKFSYDTTAILYKTTNKQG